MTIRSIYNELESRLQELGLSYEDIEAVTVNLETKTTILSRDEAREIFRKGNLVDLLEESEYGKIPEEPDNIAFYAYTKDRIFYVGEGDEMGTYWIGSLPRNPTDKERPQYLP